MWPLCNKLAAFTYKRFKWKIDLGGFNFFLLLQTPKITNYNTLYPPYVTFLFDRELLQGCNLVVLKVATQFLNSIVDLRIEFIFAAI